MTRTQLALESRKSTVAAPAPPEASWVRWVIVLAALRAVLPSGLNYLALPHPDPLAEAPAARTALAHYSALFLTVALGAICVCALLAARRRRGVVAPVPMIL